LRALIPVADMEDPRIEPYRDIRDRDVKGRGGRFVIEGEVVLRAALARGRFPIESILLDENRVQPLADLMPSVPDSVPVYVAARPVLDAVAGFPLHRGVVAIGLRGEAVSPASAIASLSEESVVILLGGIANHDNMGGILRNAAGFGVDLVLLDETCCDPLYRKAIRVSAGAALTVPFARGGAIDALAHELDAARFEMLATSPGGCERLQDVAAPSRLAVLFGAEGVGLPPSVLARLRSVRIDMEAGFDSLNVATTSGIVLYEIRRRWRPRA
jgi:tRNA G18 (ribose-2'-O)-methylase SpoU